MSENKKLKIKAVAILNENKPKFFSELLKNGVDAVEPEMKKEIIKMKKEIKKEYILKFIDPQVTIQENAKEDFKKLMNWDEHKFMSNVFVRLKGVKK